MKSRLPLVTLIALGAAAYAPLPSMAQTDVQLYIGTAPPAPLYERMPSVRRGHVWVPGYWAWNGRRHHWMPGSYIVERPGYVYAPPAWQQRGGRWYMQQGGWAPHRGDRHYAYRDGYQGAYHGGYQRGAYHDGYGRPEYRGRDRDRDGIPDRYEQRRRDTDRDGIPNRYDRDLDNDGVPNHHDRDRDGDGRRNHRDSNPDNPYYR